MVGVFGILYGQLAHQRREVPMPKFLVQALERQIVGKGPNDLAFTRLRGSVQRSQTCLAAPRGFEPRYRLESETLCRLSQDGATPASRAATRRSPLACQPGDDRVGVSPGSRGGGCHYRTGDALDGRSGGATATARRSLIAT